MVISVDSGPTSRIPDRTRDDGAAAFAAGNFDSAGGGIGACGSRVGRCLGRCVCGARRFVHDRGVDARARRTGMGDVAGSNGTGTGWWLFGVHGIVLLRIEQECERKRIVNTNATRLHDQATER